ncbi:MAG: iron-sulfur cluster assembly scaffold protein [Acidobacteria bacterium]|nr:iron-sulfur cluster assembly scaffold protein [Acidobacteriota bacterium]
MYSAAVLDHFQNPRNVGELPPPAVSVEVSNPVCGDILRLSALVEQGKFQQVRFKTRGCVASIACASLLTELVQGKSLEEAARLTSGDVASALGGLPPASGHAAVLAIESLQAVLSKALSRRP